MRTRNVSEWGANTLEACRDIVKAGDDNIDILVHYGDFLVEDERHVRTISKTAADKNIEVVFHEVSDPGVVYPHLTFLEE